MDIITKDFPVTAGEATDDNPNGTFEVVLSAPTLDRDGEVIDSRAFDPLPDHITFDTDHSMTCDSVVGSGQPYYADDGTLRVDGSFASDGRSQTIRQKITEGHIRTTSVTFMAADRETDEAGIPHIKRAELLNGTFTPVPSNREAVVVTAKSILYKEGRRNNAKDAATVQMVHDAMVDMGADCKAPDPEKTPDVEPDVKSETAEDTADSAAAEAAAESAVESADEDTFTAKAQLNSNTLRVTFGA